MKRSYFLSALWGFAITSLLGTLLHFLYDFSKESVFAAPFSGVNESTWEHMKLFYFPFLVYLIAQRFFFKDTKSFYCIKLLSLLSGLILIPVLFYTLNGAFGKTPDYINISIFFVSSAAAFLLEYHLFKKGALPCPFPSLALGLIILIGVLFVIFTFYPPHIPLFLDPIEGTYGI